MNTKTSTVSAALSFFDQGYACSQSVLLAFADDFNLDYKSAKLVSSTFGGGMGRLREKCGAVTGSFMVIGLAMGNDDPQDMERKLFSYRKVRELDKKVKELYGTVNCGEIIRKHASEADIQDRKHHKIICRKVISDTVDILWDMLNDYNLQINPIK